MRRSEAVGCAVLLLFLGCQGCQGGQGCNRAERAPGSFAPTDLAPPVEIGMIDPFASLSPSAQKSLRSGYQLLRAKKVAEAQAALQAVIAAQPDQTAARFALVRSLASVGRFAEAADGLEALLARDYVGYAARADQDKELAPLRRAPEWARITASRERLRALFARGLDHGFVFVARTRAAAEPAFAGGALEASLDLKQEIFHFDPGSKRFRRLSDTDGHVFALDRSTGGTSLSYLAVPRLHREGGVDSFIDPKVATLDLASLETVGPFSVKGRFDQIDLSANRAGQRLFTFIVATGASAAYTFDTAKTGLAKLDGDAVIPAAGETRAWPSQVAHFSGKAIAGVSITDGATQFTIEGVPTPIVAARPLSQSSIDWAPSRSRLTYAGKLDACQVLRNPKSGEKNELYVYDKAKKSAQRIAAAVSFFESLWLDDDRLVYEGGVGKAGQIHIYDLPSHSDVALPTRHGAGLYGVPTLACEQAESGVDEDLGDDDQGD